MMNDSKGGVAMPILLLIGVPVLFVLAGGGYYIVHVMH